MYRRASHDAGVSKVGSKGYVSTKLFKSHYIAQESDILSQLKAGSRFFDLRLAKNNKNLRAFHGEGLGTLGRGLGQSSHEIFTQVNDFIVGKVSKSPLIQNIHNSENTKLLKSPII